jgi:hypothetical protein
MAIWDHFESLVLEFMEARVAELLNQGDVVATPELVARVRGDAVWAAERAIARFKAARRWRKPGKNPHRELKLRTDQLYLIA